MERDHHDRVKLKHMLTEHPYTTSTSFGLDARPRTMTIGSDDRSHSQPRLNTADSRQRGVPSTAHSFSMDPSRGRLKKPSETVLRQADVLNENRVVLYKKGKQLGKGYYIVEVSSNNNSLFIAAFDVESPESFLIELPDKRAQDILKEFSNDYEAVASSLQVINRRLVLLNPKYASKLN